MRRIVSLGSRQRLDRYTVGCDERVELTHERARVWANYLGSKPPRWICTRTLVWSFDLYDWRWSKRWIPYPDGDPHPAEMAIPRSSS